MQQHYYTFQAQYIPMLMSLQSPVVPERELYGIDGGQLRAHMRPQRPSSA